MERKPDSLKPTTVAWILGGTVAFLALAMFQPTRSAPPVPANVQSAIHRMHERAAENSSNMEEIERLEESIQERISR